MINDLVVDFVDTYISDCIAKYKNVDDNDLNSVLKSYSYKVSLYDRLYFGETSSSSLKKYLDSKQIDYYYYLLKKLELKIVIHFRKHLKKHDSFLASKLVKIAYFPKYFFSEIC